MPSICPSELRMVILNGKLVFSNCAVTDHVTLLLLDSTWLILETD
jgi:hypothetical protein